MPQFEQFLWYFIYTIVILHNMYYIRVVSVKIRYEIKKNAKILFAKDVTFYRSRLHEGAFDIFYIIIYLMPFQWSTCRRPKHPL